MLGTRFPFRGSVIALSKIYQIEENFSRNLNLHTKTESKEDHTASDQEKVTTFPFSMFHEFKSHYGLVTTGSKEASYSSARP